MAKAAVTDAKQALKALNILDFYTDKKSPRNGTLYTLNVELFSLYLGQKVGQNTRNNILSFNNNNIKEGERACARGEPPPQNFCSERVRHCWIKNSGVNPKAGICEKLGELGGESRRRKKMIDWTVLDEEVQTKKVPLATVKNLQKAVRKFLKIGEVEIATSIFDTIKIYFKA